MYLNFTLYDVNRDGSHRSVVHRTGVDSGIARSRPSHEQPADGVPVLPFRLDAAKKIYYCRE